MNFNLMEAIEILERTPQALESFLSGLSHGWLQTREGEGTWNAAEIIEHLIEGERTNWIPRLEMILRDGESRPFPPFDREAHFDEATASGIERKLQQFRSLRMANVARLQSLVDPALHLELTGLHPAFGTVKLRELLSAWIVHDMAHTAQMARVIAKRYSDDVGPWKQYLGIVNK